MNNRKAWAPKPEKNPNYAYVTTAKEDNFMTNLRRSRSQIYDLTRTENGAIAYNTSGHKLLDLNFAVASLRSADTQTICTKFRDAFHENGILALRWLFFARDVRQGLGERNLFKVCMKDLGENGGWDVVNNLIPLIPEYGRWDDMLVLLDIRECRETVLRTIANQFHQDYAGNGDNISLLAKWLPSEQASNKKKRDQAYLIMRYLKLSPREYRKSLSYLRKRIDVVERKMSSNNWQAINYETVPSKANLNYSNAFLRHDEQRRRLYLDALEKGEAKINSSVAYPHDIVHKYMDNEYYSCSTKKYDPALEAMWKSLPDMVKGNSSTIVVADGSGSMCTKVGGTSVTALEVANALAIYFAERCHGQFKNNYITFSETPQLVELGEDASLKKKLEVALQHDECANTNIEAVFDLILTTAVQNHMPQEEIPANILVISDMEFDGCAVSNKETAHKSYYGSSYRNYRETPMTKTLFGTIKKRFEEAGYKMPKLIFWNVNSRTMAIPMVENDMGVILVSGFSVNICKMVMSNETDPYKALLETINNKRYDPVEEAVKKSY